MKRPETSIMDCTLSRADVAALAGGAPVRLLNCSLDEAKLADLDLTGWVFERCSLGRTDLSSSTLELTQWIGCKGPGAVLVSANLEDASFRGSDFNNASFRGAVLSSASFEECRLTGVDLTGARTLGTRFASTLLVSAKLAGLDFRKERLVGLDISSADLAGCDFRQAVFEGCSLREANIENARFQDADLRGADLTGLSILTQAGRFRGAVVTAAQAELILSETGIKVRAL